MNEGGLGNDYTQETWQIRQMLTMSDRSKSEPRFFGFLVFQYIQYTGIYVIL